MLTSIGLGLIILAWAYQLLMVVRGRRNITPLFAGVYALGALLLVIDGFSAGLTSLAYLNLATLALSAAVFALLMRSR